MGMELIAMDAGNYEMADGYASDTEVISQASLWIRDALKSVAHGDGTLYSQLIEVVSIKPEEPHQEAMLVTSLRALSGVVSSIDDVHHDSLLSRIFGMSIWNNGQGCGRGIGGFSNWFVECTLCGEHVKARKWWDWRIHWEHNANGSSGYRLIDLDVDIRWEDIPEDPSKGIFDMELEGVEGNAKDLWEDDSELPKTTLGPRDLGEVANRLDRLMEIMFDYLKSCADSGQLTLVFETLIQSFKTTVLNAYKSKFAQFAMFYSCSLDPENCGVKFACLLSDIFVSRDYSPFTRMSAVAYLASYLCRGRFLSVSLVFNTLKRVVDWCFEYCKRWDGESSMISPEAHRVFYSGCQAIIYVLCYRMRSIMDVPHLEPQLLLLPLDPILHHWLDPLKVYQTNLHDLGYGSVHLW